MIAQFRKECEDAVRHGETLPPGFSLTPNGLAFSAEAERKINEIILERYFKLQRAIEVTKILETAHSQTDDAEKARLYRVIGLDENEVILDPDHGVMISVSGARKLRDLVGPLVPDPERADAVFAGIENMAATAGPADTIN